MRLPQPSRLLEEDPQGGWMQQARLPWLVHYKWDTEVRCCVGGRGRVHTARSKGCAAARGGARVQGRGATV